MRFRTKHRVLRAMQSSIDVALWMIIDDKESNFDHKRKTYGYLLTYVDGFLLVGPSHVQNAIGEKISRVWKPELKAN